MASKPDLCISAQRKRLSSGQASSGRDTLSHLKANPFPLSDGKELGLQRFVAVDRCSDCTWLCDLVRFVKMGMDIGDLPQWSILAYHSEEFCHCRTRGPALSKAQPWHTDGLAASSHRFPQYAMKHQLRVDAQGGSQHSASGQASGVFVVWRR